MQGLSVAEIEMVSGATLQDNFNAYADVLLAGGALAVGTGVFAAAGAFALGVGGAIKLGIALSGF
jgi:hypothetical protein